MRILWRAVIYYFLILVLLLLRMFFIDIRTDEEILRSGWFFIVPLFGIVAGLLLGWFGTMIIQYARWIRSFYLAGLNLVLLVVVGWLCWTAYQHGQYVHRYGLYSGQQGRLEECDRDGFRYVPDGFEYLQANLPHRQPIRLRKWLTVDTSVPAPKDTVHGIYYLYRLDNDTVHSYLAKLEIGDKRVDPVFLSRDPNSDTTFIRLNDIFEKEKEAKRKEALEIIKMLEKQKVIPKGTDTLL